MLLAAVANVSTVGATWWQCRKQLIKYACSRIFVLVVECGLDHLCFCVYVCVTKGRDITMGGIFHHNLPGDVTAQLTVIMTVIYCTFAEVLARVPSIGIVFIIVYLLCVGIVTCYAKSWANTKMRVHEPQELWHSRRYGDMWIQLKVCARITCQSVTRHARRIAGDSERQWETERLNNIFNS